jgi:hypothetical protein
MTRSSVVTGDAARPHHARQAAEPVGTVPAGVARPFPWAGR